MEIIYFKKIVPTLQDSLYYKLDVIIRFELQMMSVLIDKEFIFDMSQDRKMYKCTCADCGKDSEVPFEPKPDRPVYCKECLPKHRKQKILDQFRLINFKLDYFQIFLKPFSFIL